MEPETSAAASAVASRAPYLAAFVKQLQAKGQKFDVEYRDVPAIGLKIAYITDPWGTTIELTEGLRSL